MEHILKVRSRYFSEIVLGNKMFEVRKTDRDYKVGDRLVMFEVTDDGAETGQSISTRITYFMQSPAYGLMDGFCIMGIKLSKRQGRANTGHRPASEEEAIEYAQSVGMDDGTAQDCFNYYSQTGWKMSSGLALADWKAAFRRWKPRNSGSKVDDAEAQKLALLLPMLLQRTAQLAQNKAEISFNDPFIGTVVAHYGWERLLSPVNSYEAKQMVQHYLTSRMTKLGTPTMRGNPHGQGTLTAPTLDEFQIIMAKKSQKPN